MDGDNRLSRVEILISQKKYAEAERTLSDLLSGDASNTQLLYLLAEVNFLQDKFDRADAIVDAAIGHAPDAPHLYYLKCRICIQQDKLDEAQKYILQSISLDSYDADYFAMLANIRLARKQFTAALADANHALEIDPENILALNTRSTVLNKLNRGDEAFATIEGALREDPNNAYTHANYGWGLLERGDHQKALEHFKESLSNDPNFEYAQSGLLEALKAKNPVYRLFMKYSFWMGNLTARYQWAVIIGFYIGFKGLRILAVQSDTLRPFLLPVVILLAIVVFSTWIITPLSNLFLRFNKYGQLLLSKKQKMSSNFVAVSLFVFLAGLAVFAISGELETLMIAAYGLTMMLPLGTMFSPSKNEYALLIYTGILAVVGFTAVVLSYTTAEVFNAMTLLYIFGFVAFQWLANYMLIKDDNR